jgi:hypothetical protein
MAIPAFILAFLVVAAAAAAAAAAAVIGTNGTFHKVPIRFRCGQ